MTTTPKYGITELEAAQSQPEIVVNEAIRVLEAMSQLRVLDKDVTTPPSSPTEGDTYIIPSGASGAWASFPFYIVVSVGGEWVYIQPLTGYMAYLQDEDTYYRFTAGSPSGWEVTNIAAEDSPTSFTVQDSGSPSVNFSGIRNLQFAGNCIVTQVDATTVRIEVLP